MQRTLLLVALAASLTALAVTLARRPPSIAPEDIQAAVQRAEFLEERIRNLEKDLVDITRRQRRIEADGRAPLRALALRHGASTSAVEAIDGAAAADSVAVAAVIEPVVQQLERKQTLLEQELMDLGVFAHFERRQEETARSYDVALNPEMSFKRRLGALENLREAGRIDADVVSAMIAIWDENDSPRVGYHVMEQLEGVVDTSLRDRILESLQDEEEPKLRARAIETLAPMMPDPHVEEWLGYLRENDPEPWVREQAADAMKRTR